MSVSSLVGFGVISLCASVGLGHKIGAGVVSNHGSGYVSSNLYVPHQEQFNAQYSVTSRAFDVQAEGDNIVDDFQSKYGYLPSYFEDIFVKNAYPISAYTTFAGADYTSLFANSVATNDKYVVVGSHGYDLYSGQVHVYQAGEGEWVELDVIPSPYINANFGISVSISGDSTIIIGANCLGKC